MSYRINGVSTSTAAGYWRTVVYLWLRLRGRATTKEYPYLEDDPYTWPVHNREYRRTAAGQADELRRAAAAVGDAIVAALAPLGRILTRLVERLNRDFRPFPWE